MNYADIVTPDEMADARDWLEGALAALVAVEAGGEAPCVSFVLDGRPSAETLPSWEVDEKTVPLPDGGAVHRIIRTDPATGLRLEVEFTRYGEFPAVEWTARLASTGGAETPVVEQLRSMELSLPAGGGLHLNYNTGDYCAADGYEPHRVRLEAGAGLSFAPDGGRSTNRAWPYYNLEYANEGRGVIAVIGWPGQWASRFERSGDALRVTAGQEITRFRLLPGEAVRAPLSVLMFWRGDRVRSQNLWRRWMIACNMPRPGGELPEPILPGCTSAWFNEMTEATGADQIEFIDRYLAEEIPLDYWWMDAGWYPCEGKSGSPHVWWNTGTWEVDARRFPGGLRKISDHVHAEGFRVLVWFEPERVAPGTRLWENRPEWLLSVDGRGADGLPVRDGSGRCELLDLGNPEALEWLTDHVDRIIVDEGIDLYRQDFNFDPLPHWRAADSPDRQGIAEIRHVEGYLAYWDELIRRHPKMLIDSCASGGRRNDLETMRRSVPLHKTDYKYDDLSAKQALAHGLAMWIPYFGAPVVPVDEVDVYTVRSAYASMMNLGFDLRRTDLDYDLLRRLVTEWRAVAPFFYGDYYPLTPYSRDESAWMAWQFDRPDLGEGIVLAFRRPESPDGSARFELGAIEPGAGYDVSVSVEPGEAPATRMKGDELARMAVAIADRPGSVLVRYRRAE